MDTNEQQDKRGQGPEEQRSLIGDVAPIAAPIILAGGQIIAAKISANGKDKGDGKS